MVVVRGGIHPSAAVRYWGHLLPDTFTSHNSILLNQSILAVEGDKRAPKKKNNINIVHRQEVFVADPISYYLTNSRADFSPSPTLAERLSND